MSKKIELKPLIVYNNIDDQRKLKPNSLTIQEWNDVINILRRQTNVTSEHIERLHRIFFGDFDANTTGYYEFEDPDNVGLVSILRDIIRDAEKRDDKTYSSNKIEALVKTLQDQIDNRYTKDSVYTKEETYTKQEVLTASNEIYQDQFAAFIRDTIDPTFLEHETDITDIQTELSTINTTISTLTDEVNGRLIVVEGLTDSSFQNVIYTPIDGKLTFIRQNEQVLVIDLPLELIVSSGSYDSVNRDVVLHLANGTDIIIPVDDIYAKIDDDVSALQLALDTLTGRATILETDNTSNKSRIDTLETTKSEHIIILNTLTTDVADLQSRVLYLETNEPTDLLKKDGSVEMLPDYSPVSPKQIADKEYVDVAIEGATGVDLSGYVTQGQLTNAVSILNTDIQDKIDEPTFKELILDEEINHIEEAILIAPQEFISLQGKTIHELSEEEKKVVNYFVNETIKNELIYDGVNLPRIEENCNQVIFDGSESWYDFKVNSNNVSMLLDISKINMLFISSNLPNYKLSSSIFTYRISGIYENPYQIQFNNVAEAAVITLPITVNNETEFRLYLSQNPLTVTYELAIKNPKTVNSNVLSNYLLFTEVDYYMYDLPVDIKNSDIIVDGVKYQYKTSNNGSLLDVGYWMITSTNQLRIMVEKNKVINNPITLTYELAEPRLAEVIGLKSVENPIIESVNENLFDIDTMDYNWYPDPTYTNAPYTTREGNTLIINAFTAGSTGRGFKIKLKPNTTYTISLDIEESACYVTSYDNTIGFKFEDRAKYSLGGSRLAVGNNRFVTFTTPKSGKIFISFTTDGKSDDPKARISNIQLQRGNVILPYTPYQSNELQINGIYHEWDKIISVDGVIKKEIGTGQVTFDGSEDWIYYYVGQTNKPDVVTFWIAIDNIPLYTNYINLKTNFFPFVYGVWDINEIGISSHSTLHKIFLNVYKSDLVGYSDELTNEQKVNLFKQWLQDRANEDNPLVVTYELAEKTLEDVDYEALNDDLAFSKGYTVYLKGTEVLPTYHVRCALDIAGQVNLIIGDLKDKSVSIKNNTDKLNNHAPRITTNETNITDLQLNIKGTIIDVVYTPIDGKLTFKFQDTEIPNKVIDLPMELLIEEGHFDAENEAIILTLANNQTLNIPVGDLITEISSRLTTAETNISSNTQNINNLNARVTKNEQSIGSLETSTLEEITLWSGEQYIFSDSELRFTLPEPLENYRYIEIEFEPAIADYIPKRLSRIFIRIGNRINMSLDTYHRYSSGISIFDESDATIFYIVEVGLETGNVLAITNTWQFKLYISEEEVNHFTVENGVGYVYAVRGYKERGV